MKLKSKLTKNEIQFCCNYVNTGNLKESAIHSGFTNEPEKIGAKLLSKPEINNEINKLYKEKKKNLIYRACCGYERLAFGSICDAVKLLYAEKPEGNALEQMDLFHISEIKRLKDGAIEIKFFDRLKALEKLEKADIVNEEEANPFYRALENGTRVFNDD